MKKDPKSLVAQDFANLAGSIDGVLGNPNGRLAYGYVRVSTSGQAEEGRTGLPRQLLHISEYAAKHNLFIPYHLLYCDDHSGFEFRDRPDLQRLLSDISDPDRQAHNLVIENLDRLSRNAKWHQGYLLDLFNENKIAVHFWKAFSSDIERAVMGAISEQGMRGEIERMTQGMRMKAQSGRVTARKASYGFQFVDSQGKLASDPTSNYRQDTHYAIHPDEGPIVYEMFHRIVAGESLFNICDDLQKRMVPTPKGAKHWATGNVSKMFKNPVYKGEFIANRFYIQQEWSERSQKMVKRQRQRPPEEWIIVPVPPIVSPKIWDEAQKALKRNIKSSTRNAKSECLLQGFMECAHCGRLYNAGGTTGPIVDGKRTRRFYICGSYNHTPSIREYTYCKSPVVYSDVIDPQVWDSVCSLIANPDILINHIEEEFDKFKRGELNSQLTYIDRQLKKCQQEEQQWDKAYAANIFSLEEYSEKKQIVLTRRQALQDEWEKISEEMYMVELFERKKELIYQHLKMLQERGVALDLPFADKRKILSMLVDKIVIDSKNGWYRLEGGIEGTYQFDNSNEPTEFTYTSAP